jgi:hypothetical protein
MEAKNIKRKQADFSGRGLHVHIQAKGAFANSHDGGAFLDGNKGVPRSSGAFETSHHSVSLSIFAMRNEQDELFFFSFFLHP